MRCMLLIQQVFLLVFKLHFTKIQIIFKFQKLSKVFMFFCLNFCKIHVYSKFELFTSCLWNALQIINLYNFPIFITFFFPSPILHNDSLLLIFSLYLCEKLVNLENFSFLLYFFNHKIFTPACMCMYVYSLQLHLFKEYTACNVEKESLMISLKIKMCMKINLIHKQAHAIIIKIIKGT